VKAGKLHASYVRDLRGAVKREKAEIPRPTESLYAAIMRVCYALSGSPTESATSTQTI
jgi:hypothetical protein